MFEKISDDIYMTTIQKLAFWPFESSKATNSRYANPKYLDEDGSPLPSFTNIRPLRDEKIDRLEEIIDEAAFEKFKKQNQHKFK